MDDLIARLRTYTSGMTDADLADVYGDEMAAIIRGLIAAGAPSDQVGPRHDHDDAEDGPRSTCCEPATDGARCESGWTGDRCGLPLFHDGPHDND